MLELALPFSYRTTKIVEFLKELKNSGCLNTMHVFFEKHNACFVGISPAGFGTFIPKKKKSNGCISVHDGL
jgi:hypothetical protein